MTGRTLKAATEDHHGCKSGLPGKPDGVDPETLRKPGDPTQGVLGRENSDPTHDGLQTGTSRSDAAPSRLGKARPEGRVVSALQFGTSWQLRVLSWY